MRTDPDWPAVGETDLEAAAVGHGLVFDDADAVGHHPKLAGVSVGN